MRVARASPSTSSAMMSSGAPCFWTASRIGRMSWMLETFWSVMRMYGESSSAVMVSLLVEKYGEM